MRFFLSAEVQSDVGEALRQAESKIRALVLAKLGTNYGSEIERWTHITILRPQIPPGWGEIKKYNRHDRVAEFRLIVDYNDFKDASAEKQVQMLMESIIRSTKLFPILKLKSFDIDRFHRDIVDAAIAGGLISPTQASPPGATGGLPASK
jgi:Immunity protein 44